MWESKTIIAFDQHAATTVAAVHPLTSDVPTIQRLVARVSQDGPVRCCYKAGPCGFELQRALTAQALP
jgi:hypothetical protein